MAYDLLIVGRNSEHRKLLQNAFPDAYVITPFQALTGYAFKRIICVGLEFDYKEKDRFKEWHDSILTLKLLPNNGGIHFV